MVKLSIIGTLLLLMYGTNAYSQIVINEVSSSNGGSYYDEDSKTPSWIELKNTSSEPFNFENCRISDKNNLDEAFVLPDTIVQPGGYLMIHSSGNNRVTKDNYIIRSSGEGIVHYAVFDGFEFLYLPCESDFEIIVNLRAVKAMGTFDKAGLMFREELEVHSKYWGVFGQAKFLFKFRFQAREELNKFPKDLPSDYSLNYPNAYLMLKRVNDTIITAIVDSTGFIIEKIQYNYPSEKKLYAGIAVAAIRQSQFMEAVFKDLRVNGQSVRFEDMPFKHIGIFPQGKAYYGGEIHTGFKLSSEGETIYLWDKNSMMMDQISFPPIGVDDSYGRSSANSEEMRFFDKPTPHENNIVGFLSVLDAPAISLNSGWFDTPQQAMLSHADPEAEIYYTTNGSDVTKEKAQKYDGSLISITQNLSIRAKAFKDGHIQSSTTTNTYFINDSLNLPVISITADSAWIFGDNGIFSQKMLFQKVEIPVHFEFWESQKKISYQANSGMQLTGEASIFLPQKSFRVYARDKFGTGNFEYDFFKSAKKKQYSKLWVRTASNDFNSTLLRDYFAKELMNNNSALEPIQTRPCVVYLNGLYWGIYFLCEYFDEEFISDQYQIDKQTVNILESAEKAKNGSAHSYNKMLEHIKSIDMEDKNAFSDVSSSIDVDNLIDYLVIQLFSINSDWGNHNVKFWQSDAYDSKWRWIMHDLDMAFKSGYGPSDNAFKYLFIEGGDLGELVNILLQNETFRNLFINRNADFMNSYLKPINLIAKLDSLAGLIADEIPRHQAKWSESAINWDQELQKIRDFTILRPDHLRYQIFKEFDLTGYYSINFENNYDDKGYIKLNSLTLHDKIWQGVYFNDIPISMTAIPKSGYSLASWGNPSIEDKESVVIKFSSSTSVYPSFVKDDNKPGYHVVINEIMYKPKDSKDSKDWVELFNPNNNAVDISGWTLKDDKESNSYIIPTGTVIPPKKYLVLAEDLKDFSKIYPNVDNVIGSFEFGFSASGDKVRLFDTSDVLVDIVEFGLESPWDPNPNGTGASLELIEPATDNNSAQSWRASFTSLGTPGKQNSVNVSVDTPIVKNHEMYFYPNPTNNNTVLRIDNPHKEYVTIELYNQIGEKLSTIFEGELEEGKKEIFYDCSSLPIGLYFVQITSSKGITINKLMVAR